MNTHKTISFVGYKNNKTLSIALYIYSIFLRRKKIVILTPIKIAKYKSNIVKGLESKQVANEVVCERNERVVNFISHIQEYYNKRAPKIILLLNWLYKTKKFQTVFFARFINEAYDLAFETYIIEQSHSNVVFIMPNTFFYREFRKVFLNSNNVSYSYFLTFLIVIISIAKIVKAGIFTIFRNKIKKRKRLKGFILRELVWGFNVKKILRDDMFVDNINIKPSDMVYYSISRGGGRGQALKEAQNRKINNIINLTSVHNIINLNKVFWSNLYYNFLLIPLYILFSFLKVDFLVSLPNILHESQQSHKLMSFVDVKWWFSACDYKDHILTIVGNLFKVKVFLIHWSDMTCEKSGQSHQTLCHNIIFSWGKIMKEFIWLINKVDLIKEIGCFFKFFPNKVSLRKGYGFPIDKKIVSFYDTTFFDTHHITKGAYINFYKVIEFIDNKLPNDIIILIKPKFSSFEPFLEPIFNEFSERVTLLNPIEYPINDVLLLSDINIGCGPNSTTTISIINNVLGIYYDESGNTTHPMTKYEGDIYVRDRVNLLKSIKKYLSFNGNIRNRFPQIEDYDVIENDDPIQEITRFLYVNKDVPIKNLKNIS